MYAFINNILINKWKIKITSVYWKYSSKNFYIVKKRKKYVFKVIYFLYFQLFSTSCFYLFFYFFAVDDGKYPSASFTHLKNENTSGGVKYIRTEESSQWLLDEIRYIDGSLIQRRSSKCAHTRVFESTQFFSYPFILYFIWFIKIKRNKNNLLFCFSFENLTLKFVVFC